MNTVLMLFGAIFLTLLFVIVVFLSLFYIWAKRSVSKLQKVGNDNIELTSSNSLDLLFDSFSDLPILGGFVKKKFAILKDGINYFNHAIPLIIADWNSQELVKRSTRNFLDSLEAGEPEKSFKSHFDNLGKLKDYKGAVSAEGNDYSAQASFEKGIAQLQVQLIQEDNQFLINAFEVHYLFKVDSGDS